MQVLVWVILLFPIYGGIVMNNALLVGNGFTSQIIREYANTYMMDLLRKQEEELFSYADQLFSAFRGNANTVRANQLFESKFVSRIIDELDKLHFPNSTDVFETYFIKYGLIYECNNTQISSVESLLKVISLFKIIGLFSDEDRTKITHTANQLYYNNGNNGLSATSPITQKAICQFLTTYTWIFTTNYDCILDDACSDREKVKHIHGGFYLKDRHHTSKVKLSPDDAYLIWGINGEDKEQQLKGGPLLDRNLRIIVDNTGRMLYIPSILEKYLQELRTEQIKQLDIFGYSGENDQHINLAISKNSNIQSIRFFCNPKDVNKSEKRDEIGKRFMLSKQVQLSLHSWSEVWDKIPLK